MIPKKKKKSHRSDKIGQVQATYPLTIVCNNNNNNIIKSIHIRARVAAHIFMRKKTNVSGLSEELSAFVSFGSFEINPCKHIKTEQNALKVCEDIGAQYLKTTDYPVLNVTRIFSSKQHIIILTIYIVKS